MIELPWPPTVNTYWRNYNGRMLLSRKGRAYQKTVCDLALVNRFPRFHDQRVSVEIVAYPPDRRRRDLDNLFKGVLDALQKAGVFDDDGQIDVLSIRRGEIVKDGLLQITCANCDPTR